MELWWGIWSPGESLLNKPLLVRPVTPETDREIRVRKPGFMSGLCHHCVGQVTFLPDSPLSYVDRTKPRFPQGVVEKSKESSSKGVPRWAPQGVVVTRVVDQSHRSGEPSGLGGCALGPDS